MNNTTLNGACAGFDAPVTFRLPACPNLDAALEGAGRVRLGGQGPVFRHGAVVDAGKVRLGGQGPAFRRPSIVDAGRVRLGGQSPLFR